MSVKLELTPWARQRLDDAQLAELRATAQTLGLDRVEIGHASGGWTCRLLDAGRVVVSDAYGLSAPMGAFHVAAGRLVR